MKKILSLISLIIIFTLTACSNAAPKADLWKNASYKEDTSLGEGAKTIIVKVLTEEKSVTFTIKTDEKILGDALKEHNLISGEEGAFGLYVKKVNGIEADYNKTKSYWAFTKNGESMMTGVDGEKISDGATYEIIWTKK